MRCHRLVATLSCGLLVLMCGVWAEEQKGAATIYNRPREEMLVTAGTSERDKSRLVKDPDARSGWALRADPQDKPGAGIMWFGYTYSQGPGRIRAIFRLKVADNTSPGPVATIRGNINNSELRAQDQRYKRIPLKGTDFTAANTYQEFDLEILKGEQGFGDWAVSTTGVTAVWFDGLAIEQMSRFTTDELLRLISPPVKPAGLVLAADRFRVHETYGLFMPHWKVSEAMRVLAAEFPRAERTQSYLKVHPQNTRLTGFPTEWEGLYRYSVIVLNNVPPRAVTLAGTMMLKQYVEDGGCLIMMGDTHGLAHGQWGESLLGPLLPVTLERETDLVFSPKPLALEPKGGAFKDLNWAEKPCTIYYHKARIRKGGRILLASGDIPLIVEGRFGKGRIIVLLTSVLGEKNPKVGGVPFWEWSDWPALMAQLIARAAVAGAPN